MPFIFIYPKPNMLYLLKEYKHFDEFQNYLTKLNGLNDSGSITQVTPIAKTRIISNNIFNIFIS